MVVRESQGMGNRTVGGISEGTFAFKDAGGEYHPSLTVVKGNGKDEDIPDPLGSFSGQVEESAIGAIDIGLAGFGNGADDISPSRIEIGHFHEDISTGEPVAGMLEEVCAGFVDVLPVSAGIEDLENDVFGDGHVDAGIEEVACVDYDGLAAALCFEGAEGGDEVVNGAVSLEQVHVFDTAEASFEGGGEDDDGHLRALLAERCGDLSAKFACSQVVIEYGDIDLVEEGLRLFDGSGSLGMIAEFAQDGRAQQEVFRVVIEQ